MALNIKLQTDVLSRLEGMRQERQPFDAVWTEVAQRIHPFAAILEGKIGDLSKMDTSQGIQALLTFASAATSLVMPQGSLWHEMTPVDEELADRDDVKTWSEAMTKRMFNVRYMPQTGFIGNSFDMWLSLGAFGTQVMMTEEVLSRGPGDVDIPPIRYRSMPLNECYLTVTPWGQYDSFYREYKLTVRQIATEFGTDNLPAVIKVRLQDSSLLNEKMTVIHAIDQDLKDRVQTPLPWPSVHILKDHAHVLREGGYYNFPIHASSFMGVQRKAYGWGPGLISLPDVKQMNIMNKTTAQAAEQAVSPAWATVEKIKGRLNLTSGHVNNGLVTEDGRLKIQPIVSGSRPDIGEALIEKKAAEIGASFYSHLWQILVNKPDMSATEAALRAQEKGELIGPPFAKQEEMLTSMVRRELAILERQAAEGLIYLPPRPAVLEGQEITLKFTSQLSKLRRATEALGIRKSIEFAAQLSAFDPAVVDNIDGDESFRILADIEGAPAGVIRPRDEVDQIRQARAQQQQQQEAAAQQQMDVENAQNAAPLIDALTRARGV